MSKQRFINFLFPLSPDITLRVIIEGIETEMLHIVVVSFSDTLLKVIYITA